MAVAALTFDEITDLKNTASVFHMSTADFVRNAVREYVEQKKQEPFYRLTANVEEASPEESAEILEMIENLTDEDREVVRVDHFFL